MNAIQDHRSIRADLSFSKKLYTRAEIRRFARLVRKTGFFDCIVSTRESTHRIVRLKFESPEQKEAMMEGLNEKMEAWQAEMKKSS